MIAPLTRCRALFWPGLSGHPHPSQDGPSRLPQLQKVLFPHKPPPLTNLSPCISRPPPSTGISYLHLANLPFPPAGQIQELYLKELRAYKIPQPKPNDAEGHVLKFAPPPPPPSPEESNLASEMKAYEEQPVEVEGLASTGEATEPEDDYFEDLKQFDEENHEGQAAH